VTHSRVGSASRFVESVASQTLIIFALRTRRVPFCRSRPSGLLAGAATAVVVARPADERLDHRRSARFSMKRRESALPRPSVTKRLRYSLPTVWRGRLRHLCSTCEDSHTSLKSLAVPSPSRKHWVPTGAKAFGRRQITTNNGGIQPEPTLWRASFRTVVAAVLVGPDSAQNHKTTKPLTSPRPFKAGGDFKAIQRIWPAEPGRIKEMVV
jgi:hypothetical protein